MKSLFNYLVENFGNVNDAVEYVKTLYPKYPKIPVKPTLPTIKSNPIECRTYADDLERYNELFVSYKQENSEYKKNVFEINTELEKFIWKLAGMNSVPEKYQDKIWNKAIEKGNYNDIYNELCELVDIFN